MSDLGTLVARIEGDTSGIKDSAGDVKRILEGMERDHAKTEGVVKASWLNVGAAIYVAKEAIELTKIAYEKTIGHFIETAVQLNKMSETISMSVETLSGLRYAADLEETSLGSLTTAITYLSRSISGINEQGENLTDLLHSIGVTSKEPEEAFYQLADALHNMESGSAKTALALRLMGRGAKDVIPLMTQGSEAIKGYVEEARHLGALYTEQEVTAAKRYQDTLKEFSWALEGLTHKYLPPVIEKLQFFFNLLNGEKGERRNKEDSIYRYHQNQVEDLKRYIEGYEAWSKDKKSGDFVGARLFGSEEEFKAAKERLEYHLTQMDKIRPEHKGGEDFSALADKMADAQRKWKHQIDATNPSLDEETKRILDLKFAAQELEDSLGQGPQDWITKGLGQAIDNIRKEFADKRVDEELSKFWENRQKATESFAASYQEQLEFQKKLDKDYSDSFNSELSKRLSDVKSWEDEQQKALAESAIADQDGIIQDYEKFLDNRNKITEIANEKRLQAERDYFLELEKMMVDHELAGVQEAEKQRVFTKSESLERQLAIYQELLSSLEDDYRTEKDPFEKMKKLGEIDSVVSKVNDLNKELKYQSDQLLPGLVEGFQLYHDAMQSDFEKMVDTAQTTAQAMEATFSDFFFDAMRGELKTLSDYIDAFLVSVQRHLADMLAKMAADAVSFGVKEIVQLAIGAFGAGVTPGGGSTQPKGKTPAISGPTKYAHAGMHIERYHADDLVSQFQGLASDEVPLIGQTDEFLVSRKGTRAYGLRNLQRINRGEDVTFPESVPASSTREMTVIIQTTDAPAMEGWMERNKEMFANMIANNIDNRGVVRTSIKKARI